METSKAGTSLATPSGSESKQSSRHEAEDGIPGKKSSCQNEGGSLQKCNTAKRKHDEMEKSPPVKKKLCTNNDKYIALDCEFVGVGPKGCRSALGRCSIVDYDGNVIADIYTKPDEYVTDYRTAWSGLKPSHLEDAMSFWTAKRKVLRIIRNKVVVGHAVHNDFNVLNIYHPQRLIRDTSRCPHLLQRFGVRKGPVSLKKMSKKLLGIKIQNGPHCSVEDSRACLALFKLVQEKWE